MGISEERDPAATVWERQRRRRAEAKEAIWIAQVILWIPLAGPLIALVVLPFVFHRPDVRASWQGSLWAGFVTLLFLVLYALAGWWVGARQSRGIWLGMALFGWSVVTAVLHGRLLSLRTGYAVLGLLIV